MFYSIPRETICLYLGLQKILFLLDLLIFSESILISRRYCSNNSCFIFRALDTLDLFFNYIFNLRMEVCYHFYHFKAKHSSQLSLLSVPIKGRTQCLASLHSNIHEYLKNADKAWNRASILYYTCSKTTNISWIIYMLLCRVSALFGMVCLFSKNNETSIAL